jgi:hypothetical protein
MCGTSPLGNPKSQAWDHVGAMFWKLGRPSARPDAATIERFLTGLDAGAAVLIVGASTRDLIAAAIKRDMMVTVADFSSRMCEDLAAELGCAPVGILQADITRDCGWVGEGRFAAILSDRLINRFTAEETVRAMRSKARLLQAGGEIRATVKHGYYPMDLRLIDLGRADGTLGRFYDERTHTIDYSAAAHLLAEALVPHGDIPRDVLLPWYLGRARETRYFPGDLETAAAQVPGLALRAREPLNQSGDCVLYVFKAQTGTGASAHPQAAVSGADAAVGA